jgi:hypothetical protein
MAEEAKETPESIIKKAALKETSIAASAGRITHKKAQEIREEITGLDLTPQEKSPDK